MAEQHFKMADPEGSSSISSVSTQNPLSRKLKKILDIRLDNDKELVDALKALSTFFGDNTLRARRNLRGDVEKRSLEISEDFEFKFRDVKEKLDEIHADIKSMDSCCNEMTQRLQTSKESTSDLIVKTTKLQNERKHIELQASIADAFLEKYQLKPEEVQALRTSKDGVIKDEFFKALARTKEIHQDCKALLRSKQQTAGLEIMESMAILQETGYEKLYRWTQEACRSMTGDSPDVNSALCRAVEALQDRQVLFKYTLDEFGTARRGAVVRCFIDALTRGGPGGTPRPIELYSHDPVRYVGDILAWLHQAIAGEKELLFSLLKKTRFNEHRPMMLDILNHIIEGVCRPFKVRVEQVITSETGPSTLFRLGNLLKFYSDTLNALFEQWDSVIMSNLKEMNELSHQMFYNSLSCHGSRLAEKVDLPPPDLSASQVVNETLQLLKDVLASHDSAITPLNERRQDYEKIFSCLLDPLVQCCILAASQLNTADMATYMINCLYHMQSTLAVYEFTDVKLEMLALQADSHTDTLVNEQASFILSRSGLGKIYTLMKENENKNMMLSNVTGLEVVSIKAAMTKFDQYLSHPDLLNMPQLELVRSTRMRDSIRKHAVDVVLNAYTKVYDEILKKENEFANASTLITRTPPDVKSLLT